MTEVDLARLRMDIDTKLLLEQDRVIHPSPSPLKMANGDILCAECEAPIPEARLKAIPGVGLCVHCAERYQQGHYKY
jgi:phage/conjugal plasmid C-4 type zinc finger TraR family protein